MRARKARSMSQVDALVGDAPTYDEMVADQAKRLKRRLAHAVARCEETPARACSRR